MRLFSYIFFFLFTTWQLIAQTYPVQVVPVLTPPYSSRIADYANPLSNRIQLQVITTDLSVQNRLVQLYVEIKGNGLTVASAPLLSGVSPLRINGGEILRLTNAELAPYFQLRNLQGITSEQYASPLPDGAYTFCFRVKDVLSGRWLSQHQCMVAYLMLNDPPILNIPTDNEQVAATDFQNIIFSWTPRQINATNVSYTFELREILDPTLDPHFAFEVSRRVLKEDDLRMTTFVYDVSKPNLIPGRRYAWRVRAISTGGLAENSVFKNNGYSEVHSFVYAVNCNKPLFLLSQQQSKSRTKLLWQGDTQHQKYHIQYRKKGVANAQWFDTSTRNTQALITNLEAGEYEFRVGATCETERYDITPSYVYSNIQTFEIEKTQNTTESAYNCGIAPKIAITNKKPLGSLVTNEVFTAGDFSVTILEVSGSNGIFSGKGFVKVPYLNDTKLAVEFENIKINADYQLTDGIVKTIYDSDWKGVQFAENFIGQGKKSKDIEIPFEIEKVETRNGEIVVTGKNSRKEVFPFGGNDSTVKGKVTTTTNGVTTTQEKIYHIDKDGKVSEPQTVAQGGKPTNENTNGVTQNGEATALTAKGIEVTFENTADSKYAYEVPTKAYSKDYQKFDGKYIPFKAVVKGETEPFLAKVQITDKNISADSLIFKTDKGALIESKRVEGSDDFLLTLKGFHSFAVEQVQATIKQGKKYQIAGVFNLVHLSPKTAKVTLVPTAENLTIDVEKVKAIYSKVGVTLDITWAAPFDISPYLTNGVLETKDVFGDLTDYSPSQQALINAYKATGKVSNDTYYVFITNAKSSTGQGGYMALGGQFGFVFDQTERTLAHELGHGIFKLAHPFKKKQQGNVPSLMDYTSDEDLLFADWKQINDPAFKIGIFQGQKEGLKISYKYIKGHNKGIAPNGKVIAYVKATKERYKVRFGIDKDYYIHKIELYDEAGNSVENESYFWDWTDFVNATTSKSIAETSAIELVYNSAKESVKTYIYQVIDDCKYRFAEIDYKPSDGIGEIKSSKWKTKYLFNAEESCTKNFILDILEKDREECSKEEIDEASKILNQSIKTPEKAVDIINNSCLSALRNLSYQKKQYFIDLIASQKKLKNISELAILRLMNALSESDYANFFNHLEANNNYLIRHLIDQIDDSYFFIGSAGGNSGGKNYTNFIGALVWMFNHNPASIEDRWGKNEDDFVKRTLNLNPITYSKDTESSWNFEYTLKNNKGEYIASTGRIQLYDVYKAYVYNSFDSKGDGQYSTDKEEPIGEVSPLTPLIIIPDKNKVPLIQTALEGNDLGNEVYIVPAIFLKYNDDKILNDYIETGVFTTLDIATIAISGGTALATKVHWIPRVWALVEVVGAVGNITANTIKEINGDNKELREIVDIYNIAMGAIGIKNLGQVGYKFAKNLPQTTKNILQKNGNLRTQLVKSYQDWKRRIGQLKTSKKFEKLADNEKKLLEGQEKGWKLLGFVGDIKGVDRLKDFLTNDARLVSLIKKLNAKFNKVDDFAKRFEELYQKVPENSVKPIDDLVDDLKHLFTEHIDEIPEGQLVAFLNELLETGDKFKAGATSLEVIRNIKSYLPAKFHSTLQKLELEDLISYADEAGDFRFDIKWQAKTMNKLGKEEEISIFIDTKNYSTATNMFKDLGQYKAYLRAIDNFDQLYIIQQGGRGITKEDIIKRLESAIAKDAEGVYYAKKQLWQKLGITDELELERLAKNKLLSKEIDYQPFRNSILITR